MSFTFVDSVIVFFFLGILMALGYWARRFMKNVAHFTVAGREMGMWLGLSTAYAEGIGLISIANYCQLGFTKGLSFVWLGMANMCVVIPLFGIIGLGIKRFRATRVQTLPQYYEMRYSRAVRIFAGIALVIGGVLNMAIFPIVGSQFLIAFLGIPQSFAILGFTVGSFPFVLFIVLGLAVFFTVMGGMVTVIITDYIQSILIFISVTVISWLIFSNVGIADMKTNLETYLGDAAFNPLLKQSIGVSFIIGFLLAAVIHRLAFPPALQKLSAAKSPRVVKNMVLLSSVFGHGRGILLVLWGIAALAMFGPSIPEGQDPQIYQRIIGAIMLRNITPPILKGIVLSGFIFAFISTVDSYLLSWSTVLTNDIICAIRKKSYSQKKHIFILRLVVVSIAAFIFFFGIYYKPSESIIQYFYITGTVFGGCGLISWFGLYWKRATAAGAWACLILATVIPTIFIFLKQNIAWMGAMNPDHFMLFISVFPAVVLIIVSLMSKKPTRFVDYGEKVKELDAKEEAARKTEADKEDETE